jgi:heptosyltransferase-2
MPELHVAARDSEQLTARLPELADRSRPIVVIVPGGAFGPSKCWPPKRFAQTADWLIDKYGAVVVTSVAPDATEQQIANEISAISRHNLVNLAQRPMSLTELKALFSIADLVITNDTGPRHIAIALRRKVITLFGPNDPAWTDTGYENEIRIIGDAPCAPCGKPKCRKPQHLCMKSITVEMVFSTAETLFGRQ